MLFYAYFSVLRKRNTKQSPNGMKLRERDFWNKRDPEDLEWESSNQRGGHEAGGRTLGGAGAPTLVTASVTSWSRVQVSWITFGEKIMFPKVSFRLDSV